MGVRAGVRAGTVLKSIGARAVVLLAAIGLVAAAAELCLRTGLIPSNHRSHVSRQGERDGPESKLLILGDSFFDRRTEIADLFVDELAPARAGKCKTAR